MPAITAVDAVNASLGLTRNPPRRTDADCDCMVVWMLLAKLSLILSSESPASR
ncbi:Uncharacterised protein [Mycobacterium tuberculosis]|uniref:Uncharacterized protein n=1 Tax=Mycobacterium tuberculosis TaxID=1773 RepID=A0A916P7Q1_MYCTX|nr:Uncharacterised protein [Mycobacterium tuberculosis]COX04819.1 Uncharacterised protein [Mycobacterium tuberculosis]COX69891.1 Uncharacterised protein [Mycobacterium tuberculosis]